MVLQAVTVQVMHAGAVFAVTGKEAYPSFIMIPFLTFYSNRRYLQLWLHRPLLHHRCEGLRALNFLT